MPDVVKKQTIKQAKASFKARGRPTLSEREARQLERSIELEQRAERAKEAEKRRLIAAAAKRTEKEKRDQAHRQQQAQLGTQRRCDRFGYKSSQFHLGAFFGKKSAVPASMSNKMREETTDGFGDDDLDDESLLDACDRPATAKAALSVVQTSRAAGTLMPPPPPRPGARVQQRKAPSAIDTQDDFDMDDESLLHACEGTAALRSGAIQPVRTANAMPSPAQPVVSITKPNVPRSLETKDDFGGFADELKCGAQIAQACASPAATRQHPKRVEEPLQQSKSTCAAMAPSWEAVWEMGDGRIAAQITKPLSATDAHEDLSSFFDDLESGTQIARQLDDGRKELRRASNASSSSFGSGGFDLTEEDMEMMMDPPPQAVSASSSLATTASWPKAAERQATPTVPVQTTPLARAITPARATTSSMKPPTTMSRQAPLPVNTPMPHPSMLPPELPSTRPQARPVNSNAWAPRNSPRAMGISLVATGHNPRTDNNFRAINAARKHVSAAIRGPFLPASSLYCSPDLGFSSTQLESFIDDDLQLTQVG